MDGPKLTLIRGLPGSGKSTLAKTLGCFHLEADMFFISNGVYSWEPSDIRLAHQWCFRTTEEAIRLGMDVVVSNTFTTKKEIQPYLDLTPNVRVIRCTGDYGSVHKVPSETVAKMRNRFIDINGEEYGK